MKSSIIIAIIIIILISIVTSIVIETDSSNDPRFREVSSELGINYTATEPASPTSGSGVYINDFNRDGRTDLLLLGGTPYSWRFSDDQPVLFKNMGDEFERVDIASRVKHKDYTFESALFFDYNNDNWQDLILLPRHKKPIFLKNNNGQFIILEVGLNTRLGVPLGASAADYNGDGCLDLFIYQSGDWTERTPKGFSITFHNKSNEKIMDDNGHRNLLYQGNCTSFTNVTTQANIRGERWSLAASFIDLNGDGLPDIHIANDYNHDYVYINKGNGEFSQVQMGEVTDRNGMSSETADINDDGRIDIFITNIYVNTSDLNRRQRNYIENRFGDRIAGNNLLINNGGGKFVDRANEFGVRKGGWGWAASIGDFDNDGDQDIFHTTEILREYYEGTTETSFALYPVFFENVDNTFILRDPRQLGLQSTDGRGVARLDVNNDGYLDIFISTYAGGSQYRLYRNKDTNGNWIEIRVLSTPNTTAIGTDVYVITDGETYHRVKSSRTGFLSQETRLLHFGLADHSTIDKIRIIWPDGTERTLTNVDVNQRIIAAPNDTRFVRLNSEDNISLINESI